MKVNFPLKSHFLQRALSLRRRTPGVQRRRRRRRGSFLRRWQIRLGSPRRGASSRKPQFPPIKSSINLQLRELIESGGG